MTLQFGGSLTDDTRSVNYDRNTFIIQATNLLASYDALFVEKEGFLKLTQIISRVDLLT